MNLCARRKVEHKGHARSAQRAHGKTPWWENNKGVVGKDFLLAENEGRHITLHLHVYKVPKYQVSTQKEVCVIQGLPNPIRSIWECLNGFYDMFPRMGGDECHLCGGRQVFKMNEICTDPNKRHCGGDNKAIFWHVCLTYWNVGGHNEWLGCEIDVKILNIVNEKGEDEAKV
jgi:hypothetical protein